jgi:hypothetical protein
MNKLTIFGVLLLAAIAFLSYQGLFKYSDKDRKTYFSLMEKADPSQAIDEKPYTAYQKHHDIHKEIWFNKKNQNGEIKRLQMVLRGKDADLILDHDQSRNEVIEKMKDLNAYIQEELYYSKENEPWQTVRFIKAKDATYYYNTNSLKADEVTLFLYQLPGHTLAASLDNYQPIMRGKAKKIELFFNGNDLNFKAHEMKATWQK